MSYCKLMYLEAAFHSGTRNERCACNDPCLRGDEVQYIKVSILGEVHSVYGPVWMAELAFMRADVGRRRKRSDGCSDPG